MQARRKSGLSNSVPRQRSHQLAHDQAEHQQADADHDAEGEEGERHRRPLVGGKILQALDRAVEAVRQDQAAEIGDLDGEAVGSACVVGNGEEDERDCAAGLPMRLDRRELGRLVLERVQPMLVADEDLQRHQHA